MTAVDTENKFEKCMDTYFCLLGDEAVSVSSHTALNAGKIAVNKKHLQKAINKKYPIVPSYLA